MGNVIPFKFSALPNIEYPGKWKNRAKHVHDYKLLTIIFGPNFVLNYFFELAQKC